MNMFFVAFSFLYAHNAKNIAEMHIMNVFLTYMNFKSERAANLNISPREKMLIISFKATGSPGGEY
jgi:hypothetical protein